MDERTLFQDADHLRSNQYRDSGNLNARAELHRRFSVNQTGWHSWVYDQMSLTPGASILECGCGPGWLWRQNLGRLPEGCQITLTDLSPGMVSEAEAALSSPSADFRFEVANITSLPYGDATFDIVVANHMLYHVAERESAFAEVRRVLKPNGRFVAATNGRQHMRELKELGMLLLPDDQASQVLPIAQGTGASAFGLENGKGQLESWFNKVTLLLYEDALEVTEVEALLAYIASTGIAQAHLTDGMRDQIRQHVAQVIASNGAFHITKESGLFVAHRDSAH